MTPRDPSSSASEIEAFPSRTPTPTHPASAPSLDSQPSTYRPPTTMVILAWVITSDEYEAREKASAAEQLARMVLEAADARPGPDVR